MLVQAVAMNAGMSVDAALQRLEPFGQADQVVIWRPYGTEVLWYSFPVGPLRRSLEWRRREPDGADRTLVSALDLHEQDREETYQLEEWSPADLQDVSGVLLNGLDALGLLRPYPARRGGGGPHTGGGAEPVRRSPPVLSDGGAAAAGRFIAYPKLDAPATVRPRQPFDLVIGLSRTPAQGGDEPLDLDLPPDVEELDLDVQVVAHGFRAPEGARRYLHVVRARFEDARVTVRLEAEEIAEDVLPVTLIAHFSYEGNLCGRAWREIRVVRPDVTLPDAPTLQGSSAVAAPPAEEAPDLTVCVEGGARDAELIWTFRVGRSVSPTDDPVELPDEKVVSTLGGAHNALSFANLVMNRIPANDGSPLVRNAVRGAAQLVSNAIPRQFWDLLGQVWRRAHDQGRVPTLLLESSEPHVPWELASVGADWVDDQGLLDPARPPFLSAQVRMGRWILPPKTQSGKWPLIPPRTRLDVEGMAVVVGDYLAQNGQRPLPKAKEEGKALRLSYDAVPLTATNEDVYTLLADEVERDGERFAVDLIHFACHGAFNAANPLFNGIVLSDRPELLDELVVSGSTIGRRRQPFVFLNACQVGSSTYQLGNYGGMAGAFLNVGFRGFVAPLWVVDDQIAHDVAIDFYRDTFDDHVPVSEVLRDVRARFDVDAADPPPSSWMAYVFYGHPSLTLDRR